VPTISVQHCLRDFAQRVQDSLDLAHEAHSFRVLQADGSHRYIGIRRVELFAGVALLRIHMAWEAFLESVFVRYMCGARSATGFAPVLLSPPKPTTTAAMADLLGKSSFLNWSPSNTVSRASVYFVRGEPFNTTLSAVTRTLKEISVIRNCFAHRSDFATLEFRSVVLSAFGYLPRGISPGRFLLTISPSPSAGDQKFLEFYANTLLGASLSIVP
jgi:hypothetical protein